MRYVVFITAIVLLAVSAETAHMLKDDRHGRGQGYDNRMRGYEFLGWGMHGPWGSGYGNCGEMGYGIGPGMLGYDAARYDKFLNDTVDLRREFNIRQFDYDEALRNRNVKSDELIRMEKEMLELQMKIEEKWWNMTDDKDDH